MRDWKANPPETKEEGAECLLDMHRMGMEDAKAKYPELFAGAYVERRGNLIVHVYPDGHEDTFEFGVELIQ